MRTIKEIKERLESTEYHLMGEAQSDLRHLVDWCEKVQALYYEDEFILECDDGESRTCYACRLITLLEELK